MSIDRFLSIDSYELLLSRMPDAGTVTINTGTFPPDPNKLFGGFKFSGFGRENGKSAIDLFTESKTVIMGLQKIGEEK